MKPRKPLRRTSTARSRQLREYRKVKERFFYENNVCFACGKPVLYYQKVLHHFYKRSGELLCWEPGFRLAHSDCHFLIHLDEKAARDANLLAPKECCDDFNRAVAHYEANK